MAALRRCQTSDALLATRLRAALFGCARLIHKTPACSSKTTKSDAGEDEEFRVYEIEGLEPQSFDAKPRKRRWTLKERLPPRFQSMPTDQDWTNIWPTASTFKWSAVPFPVRQGYVKNSSENQGVVPSKYGNLELMKGPNFLHLTPAHIKKHCAVLKQFCTQWPEGLETDQRCRQHFPVETITSDYVFAAPSINDPRARVASLKIHLSDLELDYHARDKFIRLVGSRYNKETDEVVLESHRCPLKSQNMEYLKFLLTAVYFESWKREGWEQLKELSDMEKYFWDLNTSRKTCVSLLKTIKTKDETAESQSQKLNYLPQDISDEEVLCNLPEVQQYKVAVEELMNEGENIETLNNYKNSVKRLLNIQGDVS